MFLLAGTDEHGEKIAEAAASKEQQPQEHCDGIAGAFKGLWEEVRIHSLHLQSCPRQPRRLLSSVQCEASVSFRKIPMAERQPINRLTRTALTCCACMQLDIKYDSFIRTTDAKHEVSMTRGLSLHMLSGCLPAC